MRNPLAPLVERATQAPDTPALAWSGGGLTYGELHAMARGAAARLDGLGIGPGARVAARGQKSPELIALVLACLLTGRPVLVPATDLRADVLATLLEHAGADHVVDAATEAAADGATATHDPAPDDVALMLTTSGSTGLPKVVPLSHGAIARFADWAGARFEIGPGANVLSYCGLNFDLSVLEVWTTLARGGRVVLAGQSQAARGDQLLDLIDANEVSVVQGVPMLYGLLLDAAAEGRVAGSVRHAILTGDTVTAGVVGRLPALFEGARLYNVYGSTETNDSFIEEIDVGRALELGAIPLGRPLPGVSALIVRDGRAVEGAGDGELWVSTPFQTTGYLGPASRGGAFVSDPLGRSERTYFRTGDVVRRDTAGVTFLDGRTDRQVKVRGLRVNLQEVEQALLEDPSVSEAAVVAFDDRLAGKRLHAVVRRRGGAELSSLSLRTTCTRFLTRVAIPSIIEVQDEALPRTTTGKVDRGAVKRQARTEPHG